MNKLNWLIVNRFNHIVASFIHEDEAIWFLNAYNNTVPGRRIIKEKDYVL